MDNNTFSFYSNVFGLFIGATTILGVLLGFYRSHLSSQRIKELEGLLGETQGLYEFAVENGLLPDETLRSQMRDRFADLREATLNLRSRAYSATTLLQDYREFWRGLSYSIGNACFDLKTLRASVISTSEAERRKIRLQEGCGDTARLLSHLPPQIHDAFDTISIPRIQFCLPEVQHARHSMAIADVSAAQASYNLNLPDVEVDLTELNVLCNRTPTMFSGSRLKDTHSIQPPCLQVVIPSY